MSDKIVDFLVRLALHNISILLFLKLGWFSVMCWQRTISADLSKIHVHGIWRMLLSEESTQWGVAVKSKYKPEYISVQSETGVYFQLGFLGCDI